MHILGLANRKLSMKIGRPLLNHGRKHTTNEYTSEARYHDPLLVHSEAPCSVVANENLFEGPNFAGKRLSGQASIVLNENNERLRSETEADNGASIDLILHATESQEENDNDNEDRIVSIYKKIEKGLVTLGNKLTPAPAPDLLLKTSVKSYESYAAELFQLASEAEKDTRVLTWWLRFIAGCILSFS